MAIKKEEKENIENFINDLYLNRKDDEKIEIATFIYSLLFDQSKHNIFSFEQMSENGILYEINDKVLHKYGLALAYNVDTKTSDGCLIAEDFKFNFSEDTKNKRVPQFEKFKNNYKNILKNYND